MPAPAAGEEVDRRGEEWKQAAQQDELDRPPGNEPRSRPHEGLCAARDICGGVEGAEQDLRGPAQLVHVLLVQGDDCVARGRGGARTCRAERHGGRPLRDEGGLAVEAKGEGEVDQLREGVRTLGGGLRLILDARLRSRHERRDRCARGVAGEVEMRRPVAPDRVEVDHRRETIAQRPVLCELG
jgi:hypothetical protein